jgi:hypothetical protein
MLRRSSKNDQKRGPASSVQRKITELVQRESRQASPVGFQDHQLHAASLLMMNMVNAVNMVSRNKNAMPVIPVK